MVSVRFSLRKTELVIGVVSIILTATFLCLGLRGYTAGMVSLLMAAYAFTVIRRRKEHVFYDKNMFLYALSLFSRLFAYTALIFIASAYPKYDVIYYVSSFICLIYAVLAYINNRQSGEPLSMYLYFQVLTVFFILVRY